MRASAQSEQDSEKQRLMGEQKQDVSSSRPPRLFFVGNKLNDLDEDSAQLSHLLREIFAHMFIENILLPHLVLTF